MITLYQFPISHYCEKVRWALAYKKIDHQLVNLLPGFHAKKMIQLTGKHSVPVIEDNGIAVQNSSEIIDYLEENYPDHALTPHDDIEKKEVLEWERLADEEIGPHIRRICYYTLLDHPKIVVKFFTQGGPWHSAFLIRIIFPRLRNKMRKLMNINSNSVADSKIHLETALDRVSARLENNQYLVGNQFSRADLAVAALLAPFCSPDKYGLVWPEIYPEPLASYINQHKEKLDWVSKIYRLHR